MTDAIKLYLRYTSWPIIAAMLALMAIGVSAIRVAEQADAAVHDYSTSQMIFACVALGAFVAATVVPYQKFGRAAYALFAGTILILVLVFFLRPSHGSHRWIDLKVVKIQPSEIAKLAFILMLAWYLRYGDNYRRLRGLAVPFLLTLLPMALVLKEPDLGTSLLFLPTLYFMLFMAGARLKHLLGVVALGTVLCFLPVPVKYPGTDAAELQTRRGLAYWNHGETSVVALPLAKLEWHQVKRIDGWLHQDDQRVIQNRGWQLHYSKMLLGAGSWTGRGDWNNTSMFFRLLPDDHTDFIFSVVGGQWGFAGCAGVLALYGVIFLFGIEIAVITNDPFGRLLAVGALALLLSQICINAGMTMGLMPVTGMTLPLVSYGGSSLVVNCAALGLLVDIGQRRPVLLARRPFEHGQGQSEPAGTDRR